MKIEIKEITDAHFKPLYVVYKDGEMRGAFTHKYRAENLAEWLKKEDVIYE